MHIYTMEGVSNVCKILRLYFPQQHHIIKRDTSIGNMFVNSGDTATGNIYIYVDILSAGVISE